MGRLIIFLIFLFILLLSIQGDSKLPELGSYRPNVAKVLKKRTATKTMEVIHLTEDNMVVLDQDFNDRSIAQVMLDLQSISSKMKKSGTIYLVMNSPGGSVEAGLSLITFAKALPQKIKTLSIFAASMGFYTVQSLGERLVLPNATLMAHRATFQLPSGQPGRVIVKYKFVMTQLESLDRLSASRMGLPYKKYLELLQDEYWVYGANAVKDGAADRVVLASCSDALTHGIKVIPGNLGDTRVSKCPLITGNL